MGHPIVVPESGSYFAKEFPWVDQTHSSCVGLIRGAMSSLTRSNGGLKFWKRRQWYKYNLKGVPETVQCLIKNGMHHIKIFMVERIIEYSKDTRVYLKLLRML